MRVVHVINGLTTGGAETVLYRLTTYPSEVEHEVICLERRASYSGRLEAAGIPVHHLDWTSPQTFPGAWIRLRRLIRGSRADVVQAWMYRSNILAGIAGKSAGIPVVWNIRCSSVKMLRPATRVLARLGGLLSRWLPSRTINCSAASVELHTRLGYDPATVDVIPNGYDPGEFRPDAETRSKLRSELGIGDELFLIGNFGRWEPEKGCSVLLAAIASLRSKGIALRLVLAGPGLDPANKSLMRLIGQSGCADVVEVLGERADIADVARALDLHVLPSLTEGFPNVVPETMLCGTPNVATDVGDSKRIVAETGWIVSPGDPQQLAAAIERAHGEWSGSREAWGKRQSAARRRIADNFPLDGMVRRYQEVWSEAASRSTRRASAAEPGEPNQEPNRPLRILHVINSLTLGGAEALLYRMATGDEENEHVVISLAGPAWYSARLEAAGIRVHHIDMASAAHFPRGVLQLRKLVEASCADVVQCWLYRANLLGGLAGKRAGKPVVWGIHCSSLEPLRPMSRGMARLGGMFARWVPSYVINCSTRSAEIHRALGYSAAEGAVVHNGYDASVWKPDEDARSQCRKALGVESGEFVIGTIARWDAQKDIPNLLAALRAIGDRGIPFRCFLIGADLTPENKAVSDLIERSGLGERVVPLGPRSDVGDLARALDLHVLASCGAEAFPNAVAESMLSGTPNVVTDVGDSAYMVGGSGWVVPPRDPERLADAIASAYGEWADSRAAWSKRREAAREQIAGNFSFRRMVEAYRGVWRTVAARSRDHSSLKPTAVQ